MAKRMPMLILTEAIENKIILPPPPFAFVP
jgi:hypothetical protein